MKARYPAIVASVTFLFLLGVVCAGSAQETDSDAGAVTVSGDSSAPVFREISLSGWWLALLVLTSAFWLFIVDRVNNEAVRLNMRRTFWNMLMFIVGAAGLALAWFVDSMFCPLTIAVLVLCGQLFVAARNRRVPEDQRALTVEYLRLKLAGLLGKVGIHVNPRTFLRRQVPGREMSFIDSTGSQVNAAALQRETPRGPEAMTCLKEIIDTALGLRASALSLQPKGQTLKVRLTIDGVQHERLSYPWELGNPATNLIKKMSGIRPEERTKAQSGGFAAHIGNSKVDLLVNTFLSVQGESLAMRLALPQPLLSLDRLGMGDKLLKQLKELLKNETGLLLVVVPHRNGRTTTIAALLHEIGAAGRDVAAVSRVRMALGLEKSKQHIVSPGKGQSFPKAIASATAGVIGVDELPDQETAKAVAKAAEARFVVAGVDGQNAIAGIYRLFSLGAGSWAIWSVLKGAMAQRLVRVLCRQCRSAYTVKLETLGKLGVKADRPLALYKPRGCPACGHIGFRGRTGVFELLEPVGKEREIIRLGEPPDMLLAEVKKRGFVGMRRAGLAKVLAGMTSADELRRALKS